MESMPCHSGWRVCSHLLLACVAVASVACTGKQGPADLPDTGDAASTLETSALDSGVGDVSDSSPDDASYDGMFDAGGSPMTSILVSSEGANEVLEFDLKSAKLLGSFKSTQLARPGGLAWGPDGNLYVASRDNDRVLRFDGKTRAFIDAFIPSIAGPMGLRFGPGGDLFVSSKASMTILRHHGTTGAAKGPWTKGGVLAMPAHFVFGAAGELFVSSRDNDTIVLFDGAGGFKAVLPVSGSVSAPAGLTLSPSGLLLVASPGTAGGGIVGYDTTGKMAGEGSINLGEGNSPSDVLLSPDGKTLYVSEVRSIIFFGIGTDSTGHLTITTSGGMSDFVGVDLPRYMLGR